MNRILAHRLIKLERQARARELPTWAEVDTAVERLRTAARAHVDAVLHGHAAPGHDAAQTHADSAIVGCWCTGHGTRVEWESTRARLKTRLTTIAARHAIASFHCLPAPSPH